LEIIVAIIKALFGLDEAEVPPPRPRRSRQPAVEGAAGKERRAPPQEAGPDRQTSLDDIFRQLFGDVPAEVERERESSPPPPPPPPFPPPIQPEQPVGKRRRRTPDPWVEAARKDIGIADPVQTPPPIQAAMAEPAADGADGKLNRRRPALVARLCGNPSELREAFVFSEIFGRPLAERRRD
jgi:hypothetical protein